MAPTTSGDDTYNMVVLEEIKPQRDKRIRFKRIEAQ